MKKKKQRKNKKDSIHIAHSAVKPYTLREQASKAAHSSPRYGKKKKEKQTDAHNRTEIKNRPSFFHTHTHHTSFAMPPPSPRTVVYVCRANKKINRIALRVSCRVANCGRHMRSVGLYLFLNANKNYEGDNRLLVLGPD